MERWDSDALSVRTSDVSLLVRREESALVVKSLLSTDTVMLRKWTPRSHVRGCYDASHCPTALLLLDSKSESACRERALVREGTHRGRKDLRPRLGPILVGGVASGVT